MAYVTITPGQVDADSPLNETLMDQIRLNFDALVAGGGIPNNYITGVHLLNYTSATTYTIAEANTEDTSTTSDVPQKTKEIGLPRSGYIDTSFEAKWNGVGEGHTHAQVYINGVAAGTLHQVANSTYNPYTDTGLSVTAQDLVQLYIWGDNGSLTTTAKNFKIMTGIIPDVIIIDS